MLIALLFACNLPEPDTDTVLEAPPVEDPAPDVASMSVHEWGWVHQGAAEARVLSSAWPQPVPPPADGVQSTPVQGHPNPDVQLQLLDHHPSTNPHDMAAPRKPVVYVHGAGSLELAVAVTDGALREVWPPVDHAGARVSWQVTASGAPCETWQAPPADDPVCMDLPQDGVGCEAAELRDYLQGEASCLSAGGSDVPVLLYNAVQAVPAPLALADGVLSNPSTVPVGPVYAVPEGPSDLPPDVGWTPGRVYRLAELAPGASVTLADEYLLEGPLPAAVHADLLAAGLTEAESSDFGRAWATELASPPWGAMGLLTGDAVEARLPMHVEPEVERVRVLAVSVDR